MKTIKISFRLIFLFTSYLIAGTYSGGDGSSDDPYQIATTDDLIELSNISGDWGKHFIQTADIDLDISPFNSGSGWDPIADDANKFTGTYDGDGNVITNLFIDRSSTNLIGLFGSIDGVIKNLGLENVDITGDTWVGGIAGANYNEVNMCYTTGSVNGSSSVGGLLGWARSQGGVTAISNCYSRADVSGSSNAGGLLGSLIDGAVEDSYSTGAVSGSNDIGGLIGYSESNSVTNSFWDETTSGQSSSAKGTAKNTSQMKTESTFTNAGWDFTNTWIISIGTNDGYPYLQDVVPLPVELTSFEGFNTEEGVVLNWETATETNNYGFEVQKSEDRSQNPEESWANVGFVQGHGTTNSPKSYSFTDSELPNGESVDYRLKQIDNDGTFAYSKIVTVDLTTVTDIDDEVVYDFALEQNYPNPFNPTTTLKFTIPSVGDAYYASPTKLIVYDILGREVATLVNQNLHAGNHEIEFDASNLSGGMYIYRISVGDKFNSVKKMLMIK